MKIKKSFLAIMAVLTLFAASASTSFSSFVSVEANAATHHKNEKKHKKAKKSSKKHKKTTKKHKKTTKKHKKKATKKSKKKATKKHSKKKVAKKKKNTYKKHSKKSPKKHVAKTPAGPTPITYSKPTITINPDGNPFKVEYTNHQSKDYNLDISNHQDDEQHPHDITLKKVDYYQLSGNSKYKTAVVLRMLVKNYSSEQNSFFTSEKRGGTDITSNVGNRLSSAWDSDNDFYTNIPGNSQQVVNLTFVGTDASAPSDFSTFTFDYNVGYFAEFGTTINF